MGYNSVADIMDHLSSFV